MGEANRQTKELSCCAGKAADLVMMSACELSRAIRFNVVSCCEVMEAYLTQIDRLNPIVNAIIVLADRDELMAQARQRDDCLRRGEYLGWMHGFPIATNCRGDADIGATPLLRPREGVLSAVEDRISARLLGSGGIVIGTANSSVCGPSGNNDIGIARNAYDHAKTAGGNGAAVALALRMVPVAEGSEDVGSLRIPAAFNNVFGFRPSVRRMADDAADFNNQGLPMGVQIMSRHGNDLACLQLASAYEEATDWIHKRHPRLLDKIESECGSH
jgi:Asp-tRNA(Asn)/Glu-tRNA(Gln) amidotransferase A subunit family amidase